jgi:hypothetical protein
VLFIEDSAAQRRSGHDNPSLSPVGASREARGTAAPAGAQQSGGCGRGNPRRVGGYRVPDEDEHG